MTKQSKPDWRSNAWVVAIFAIGIAIVIAMAYHPDTSAHVEPFGKYFYAANDVVGVRAANAFCMARKEERQMRPGNVLGAGRLVFECVKSDDEVAADKRAAAEKDAAALAITPSPADNAKCAELRNQEERMLKDKSADPLETLALAEEIEKCSSKR